MRRVHGGLSIKWIQFFRWGDAGSVRVFTVGHFTVPGERLGPGESLCDDQRWG